MMESIWNERDKDFFERDDSRIGQFFLVVTKS